METVRLADLETELPTVELPDGTEATVKRLDGVAAGYWYEWTNAEEAERDPRVLWHVTQRCLPDVDEAIVMALTAPQCGAVLAVASGNVERVLEALRKGMGAENILALASDPTIPSAPPSSPSPEPQAEAAETSP